jgi:hypothetical protein
VLGVALSAGSWLFLFSSQGREKGGGGEKSGEVAGGGDGLEISCAQQPCGLRRSFCPIFSGNPTDAA